MTIDSPANTHNNDRASMDIHLVLNETAEARKSVVATWLAELLISRGRDVHCIDSYSANRSHLDGKRQTHGRREYARRGHVPMRRIIA
jgi:hypothetical protein